jgi:hypothetical protein
MSWTAFRWIVSLGKKPTADFARFIIDGSDRSIERIAQLYDDLERQRKTPAVFAENVGVILRDEMLRRQRMPHGQYLAFAAEITGSIQRGLLKSPAIFQDLYAFLPTLEEVWIACEPTLDLIPFSEAYRLLIDQLSVAERVIYYQADSTHFAYLTHMLRKHGVEEKHILKLRLCKIEEPYRQPVALYFRSQLPTIGFVASCPPPLERREAGYLLERQLPRDWMRPLSEPQTKEHEQRLRTFLDEKGI